MRLVRRLIFCFDRRQVGRLPLAVDGIDHQWIPYGRAREQDHARGPGIDALHGRQLFLATLMQNVLQTRPFRVPAFGNHRQACMLVNTQQRLINKEKENDPLAQAHRITKVNSLQRAHGRRDIELSICAESLLCAARSS